MHKKFEKVYSAVRKYDREKDGEPEVLLFGRSVQLPCAFRAKDVMRIYQIAFASRMFASRTFAMRIMFLDVILLTFLARPTAEASRRGQSEKEENINCPKCRGQIVARLQKLVSRSV